MNSVDLEEPTYIDAIAQRIGAAIAEPFTLSTAQVQVSASIGIAFVESGTSPERVLQEADTAMYQAKRNGGARHTIIDLRAHRVARHRAELTRDLQGAITRHELRTVYQPIITAEGGVIHGFETLLRWRHATHGMIPPATAISLAEEFGMIAEIGQWALRQACLDLQSWQASPTSNDLSIWVNVSAHQLVPNRFLEATIETLNRTGIAPNLLTLEITESAFVADAKPVCHVLTGLKDLGVRIALDDFGTGHTSMRDLKHFPVDIVKIDRDFIADLASDLASHLIVESIVRLSHSLGISVVAEGIETEVQHTNAINLGCDYCQGFYLGRPAPAQTVGAQLIANQLVSFDQ